MKLKTKKQTPITEVRSIDTHSIPTLALVGECKACKRLVLGTELCSVCEEELAAEVALDSHYSI